MTQVGIYSVEFTDKLQEAIANNLIQFKIWNMNMEELL